MITEQQVNEELNKVIIPGAMRNLVKMNLVSGIAISDQTVKVTLASAALNEATQDWIRDKTREHIGKLVGVNETHVEFVEAEPKELNQIRHVIAVMSGNGGVGKSLVTGLLAIALSHHGYEVGILDADITGPSIPKMFGISTRPMGSDTGILPVPSRAGIGIMSINLLLEHEDDAVIWRGPLIGKAIQQFWDDVLWGNLDYLLVDLPPGTADAPLTVMQSLPISGVVIIFTPQDLAAMVVRKAMSMAQKMNIPILGVIENMSYFLLPDTGKKLELFGRSKGQEMAKAAGAPLLGQLPIDAEIAKLCDEGDIEHYQSSAFTSFSQSCIRELVKLDSPKTK
jgi:hydrogenase maturation protease